ncbi:VanZ family protein [Bacillus atrophaeus]|uniref:VanZ family protein n=1 Tax=Bacillus atrophaeus TaxID=1452 RepID=UPI00227FE59D|nr:VanZ family protein [Bacillus atrophaeus]MCY8521119.1 VanZ family protein [Bacillus atrophaeus]MCY8524262.1 VanZ family protein [Bacillus atrophaeus]
MEAKLRKLILTGTILYTILVLYFLFFAFNRVDHASDIYGYVFMLVPETVPLQFPQLTFSWIYDFGNVAAFIPFGILIPLLYCVRFGKFISLFVLSILVLETLQSLTHLGSFDVDDVISNTLGAVIGFIAYRVGFSSNISYKKLIVSALSIVVLLIGVMMISETINYAIEKREGPIQALTDVKEITGTTPMTENLPSFTIKSKRIKPKMNMYSSEGNRSKKYIYILGNKKDVMFYSYYGIPDNVDFKGEVTIIADGNLIAQYNEKYNKEAEALNIPFDKINEITIIVSGNAKLWDVGFSEMKHWWVN